MALCADKSIHTHACTYMRRESMVRTQLTANWKGNHTTLSSSKELGFLLFISRRILHTQTRMDVAGDVDAVANMCHG